MMGCVRVRSPECFHGIRCGVLKRLTSRKVIPGRAAASTLKRVPADARWPPHGGGLNFKDFRDALLCLDSWAFLRRPPPSPH